MITARPKKTYIYNSQLILIAFFVLLFSRSLDALGAPSLINFAHFAFVPVVFAISIVNMRTHDRVRASKVQATLLATSLFFIYIFINALLNEAAVINVVLSFLLLAEPFLLLLAITSTSISKKRIGMLKKWMSAFVFYNLFLVFFQAYVLRISNPDFIYGALPSVAGASNSSIISSIFAFYYLVKEDRKPLWIRVSVILAAFCQIIVSDAKFVLGSWILGFILLSAVRLSRRTILYFIVSVIGISFVFWGMENLEIFRPYSHWIEVSYFTNFDSEFSRAKLKAFVVIPQYFDSFLGWFFGLGPGHGIGRLGGWMVERYGNLLQPLGVTHPFPGLVSEVFKEAVQESRNVAGTAMFSPVFSWAGIWSELGLLGLGAYLGIWWVVWRSFCIDDFSRYLVMFAFSTGFFPGYLEEPLSMLFIVFIIGLNYQEKTNKAPTRKLRPVFSASNLA